MRELHIRRLLPLAGIIPTFSLSGCQAKEGDDAPTAEEVVRDLCEVALPCNPEYEGTVEDCVDQYVEYYEDYVREEGEECGEAMIAFFRCMADNYECSMFEEIEVEECYDEYADYVDYCDA